MVGRRLRALSLILSFVIVDARPASDTAPAGGGSERAFEIEHRLIAILESDATAADKKFACKKLSLIGSGASVPALAALLAENEMSHMARFALERISGPVARAALREALPRVPADLKVGIIASLGVMADSGATAALASSLSDPDALVAAAAALALGKIGSPEAVSALEGVRPTATGALRPAITEACAVAAENLLRRGDVAAAARIFRQLEADGSAGRLRLGAFRGRLLAGPEQAFDQLRSALAGGDDAKRSLSARILAEMGDARAVGPYLALLPSLPVAGQLAILDAIRIAGWEFAREAVLTACESDEPSVRVAALRAMGAVGNADDVPRLARAAAHSGPERPAAHLALVNLPGRAPSEAILKLLADARPPLSLELIDALAARGATVAAPELARLLNDPGVTVRHAAVQALASLGDETRVPAIIAFLKKATDDDTRRLAAKSLESMVSRLGPSCLGALLEGFGDADVSSRILLLPALGRIGGPEALKTVRATVADGGPVGDAALRVLAAWPGPEAMPELLQRARQGDPSAHRALAFRGYVRLCLESRMTIQERLMHLTEAAKLARGTEERLLVTSALAEVPDPGSVNLLAPWLDDPALADAVTLAVVRVAGALGPRHKKDTIPILQNAVAHCANADPRSQATDLLKKFGAE